MSGDELIELNMREWIVGTTALFEREFGSLSSRPAWRFFVPGRIEVLGKHTDYAGGRSLLAASSCGIIVVSSPNGTDRVRLANEDPRFTRATFPLSPDLEIQIGPWTNYPMTVARRLVRNFGDEIKLQGVDVAFASMLPPASGMSSSSAMIVASYFAIAGPNAVEALPKFQRNIRSSEDLAMFLACNENGRSFHELDGDRGVGTFGGSEDHTAMLCCEPGELAVYSFCPTKFERRVKFPEDLWFVVCHSGVFAEKTGAALEKYNSVSARARKACEAYNAHYRTNLETLADIVHEHASLPRQALLEKFEAIPGAREGPDFLLDRFRQFATESGYFIPRAADALERGDFEEFGYLVDQSHCNSRTMLGNIIPEVDFLQQSARRLGAIAASGFGAGFGGSVYAIVHADETEGFREEWEAAYWEKYPQHRDSAIWLTTRPAGPARRLEV